MTTSPGKPYKVVKGFVAVPVRRGITEIEHLLELIQPLGGIVLGGYARYVASPSRQPVFASDVDVYCENEKVFDDIEKLFGGMGMAAHETSQANTYKSPAPALGSVPHIQLIRPVEKGRVVTRGSMTTILSNFDFSVARAAVVRTVDIAAMELENSEDEIRQLLSSGKPWACVVDANFAHDEELRILRLMNIHCPVSSLLRCVKYATRGYKLGMFEAIKLFVDWESRGPDYRQKLAEAAKLVGSGGALSGEELDVLYAMMRID